VHSIRRPGISQDVTTEPVAEAPAFGRLARQASIRFSGLAFDKILGYVFALFVAKTYGSTAFGIYVFGVGLFEIAYALTELGLERSSIRAIADAAARGRTAETKGVMRATLLLTFPFATAVAIATVVLAPGLCVAFGRPELGPFLQLAAVAVPASLIADAHLWATEGLGYQRYMALVRMVIEPVVKVAIAVTLFGPFGKTTEAEPLAVAYAGATITSATIAYGIYRRFVLPRAVGRPTDRHAVDLLRVGLPVCGLNLLSRVLSWWHVFLVFTFVSSIATTHYAIAYRTALLTAMVASAFDAAFRPRIAGALAVDKHEDLAREYLTVSRAVLTLCLPALVMLVAFPARVMPVLGDQFAASAEVAAIIAAGTLASYVVGPAATALTMAGRSRIPLVNGIVGSAIGMLTGLALVMPLGPVGVAIGQCLATVVWNALHAVAAYRVLGVVGVGREHVRPLLATIVAIGAGAAANAFAPTEKYLAFVVVGSAVLVSYAGTLAAAGIRAEDWDLMRGALRLVRRAR
jgi:O-antigen/teichoic acid export membrane protein